MDRPDHTDRPENHPRLDNIILISIVTGGLAPERRPGARKLGLLAAVVSRLVLLGSIFWLTRLTAPLFMIWTRRFPCAIWC